MLFVYLINYIVIESFITVRVTMFQKNEMLEKDGKRINTETFHTNTNYC